MLGKYICILAVFSMIKIGVFFFLNDNHTVLHFSFQSVQFVGIGTCLEIWEPVPFFSALFIAHPLPPLLFYT